MQERGGRLLIPRSPQSPETGLVQAIDLRFYPRLSEDCYGWPTVGTSNSCRFAVIPMVPAPISAADAANIISTPCS